jgi:hypothetical protein
MFLRDGGDEFVVTQWEDYHFVAEDGSVFTVQRSGLFRGARRNFVAGPRAGQSESITWVEEALYEAVGEALYGRHIPAGLFNRECFIPGLLRDRIPLTDEYGRRIGYIDEDGPHIDQWRVRQSLLMGPSA